MAHAETIVTLLRDRGGSLCDDCLAALTGITPRQTARAVALRLAANGVAKRDEFGMCGKCRQPRHCTFLPGANAAISAAPAIVGSFVGGSSDSVARVASITPDSHMSHADRPWHWEGHVQAAVERWLREHGWTIDQAVDTASKQQGTDLVATLGERRLWVTVKGFPDSATNSTAPTQARHWFSGAMFDVIVYRERPCRRDRRCLPRSVSDIPQQRPARRLVPAGREFQVLVGGQERRRQRAAWVTSPGS
jgi:hypothetical protein